MALLGHAPDAYRVQYCKEHENYEVKQERKEDRGEGWGEDREMNRREAREAERVRRGNRENHSGESPWS